MILHYIKITLYISYYKSKKKKKLNSRIAKNVPFNILSYYTVFKLIYKNNKFSELFFHYFIIIYYTEKLPMKLQIKRVFFLNIKYLRAFNIKFELSQIYALTSLRQIANKIT